MIESSFEAFAQIYEAQGATGLFTRLVGGLETPVSAFLKISAGRQGRLFLLESVEGGGARARYSMIGLDPDVVWRCMAGKAEINRQALTAPEAFVACREPSLDALRALIAESRIEAPEELPPMAAGVFGYLGYDMVRQMERLAPAKSDAIGVPAAVRGRPRSLGGFDRGGAETTGGP